MAVGIIIQAANWLAEHALCDEPSDDELRAKFGLGSREANEARRASHEIRQRRAFEGSRSRFTLSGIDTRRRA